jgi:hypothetical protein
MAEEKEQNFFIETPWTWRDRVLWRLLPSAPCPLPEAPASYADCVVIKTVVRLSVADRLRVLVTGWVTRKQQVWLTRVYPERVRPMATERPATSEQRCEGRYPVPQTAPPRDEPFEASYRCGLAQGHEGPHGPTVATERPEQVVDHRCPEISKDSLQGAFVSGAKWWEFVSTNGTMWASDRDKAWEEAERRYPGADGQRTAAEAEARIRELEEALKQRVAHGYIDATPNGGYARRILQHYRNDCDGWYASNTDGGQDSPLVVALNKTNAARKAELDLALRILAKGRQAR